MCRDTHTNGSLEQPPSPTAGVVLLVSPVANSQTLWSLQYLAQIYGHFETWIPNFLAYPLATLPHTQHTPAQVSPVAGTAGTWTPVTHSFIPVAGKDQINIFVLKTEVSTCPM